MLIVSCVAAFLVAVGVVLKIAFQANTCPLCEHIATFHGDGGCLAGDAQGHACGCTGEVRELTLASSS